MIENINEGNFALIAAKYYDNPSCMSTEEFNEDLNRIKYLKRLFHKYKTSGIIKERLVLNHLIILYNVFEPTILTRMLCLRLNDHLDLLKPFIVFLNYWPEQNILSINNQDIDATKIMMDAEIISILRRV